MGMLPLKTKLVLLVFACSLAVDGVGWGPNELLKDGSATARASNEPNSLTVIPQVEKKPEGGPAKQDLVGDPLPSGAVAQLGTLHGGMMTPSVSQRFFRTARA